MDTREPRLMDHQHRALVLGVVGVVVAFAFESIAVATAMPVAARELDGVRHYGLAFSLFLTTSLLGMVLAGVVCDRRGPVVPFMSAAVIFVTGLVMAGSAESMWLLVLARAVQGFGGGLNIVALYVVVGRAFPETLRPRVFSAISGAWIVPAVVGPVIAGFLADEVSWRWVFIGVVPLTVGATLLVLPRLIRLHHAGATGPVEATGGGRDAPGRMWPALGAACGTGMLQYAGQDPSLRSVPLAVVGAGLLIWSVPRLLPSGALRLARGLPTVVVLRGVYAGAFFAAETFLPLMLVEQRGLATTWAGASLTGAALTWSLGSWYQGRPGLGVSRAVLVTVGLALVALGTLGVALTLWDAVPASAAAASWLVAGLGMGLGVTSLSVLLLESSPVAEQGANSAALQVSDALGSIVMIGLAGALFAALHGRGHDAEVYLLIFALTTIVAAAGSLVAPRAAVGPARGRSPHT